MNWNTERMALSKYLGKRFTAPWVDSQYEWQADTVLEQRNEDRRPFLMAFPIRRISGSGKEREVPLAFLLEDLPPL